MQSGSLTLLCRSVSLNTKPSNKLEQVSPWQEVMSVLVSGTHWDLKRAWHLVNNETGASQHWLTGELWSATLSPPHSPALALVLPSLLNEWLTMLQRPISNFSSGGPWHPDWHTIDREIHFNSTYACKTRSLESVIITDVQPVNQFRFNLRKYFLFLVF